MYRRLLLLVAMSVGYLASLPAQKCKDLERWGERIEREFPGLAPERLVYGSRGSDRLLFLLYADENFVPASGISFSQLSESKRMAQGRKLRRCQIRSASLEPGTRMWLSEFGLRPLSIGQEAARVENGISSVSAMREQYAALMANVKKEEMGSGELERLAATAGANFSLLWPSEIETLKESIGEVSFRVADRELTTVVASFEQGAPSPELLQGLVAFEQQNEPLLRRASPAAATDARHAVSAKQTSILNDLLPDYARRVEEIDLSDPAAYEHLERERKQIAGDFPGLEGSPEVARLLQTIRSKKTTVVKAMAPDLRVYIDGAETVALLASLERALTEVDGSDPAIRELSAAVQTRKQAIRAKETRREQAAAAAAAAERQKIASERQKREQRRLTAERNIARRRQELQIKYGANLPTFEQLFYVRAYGAPIAKRYRREDGVRFKNYVEGMGYMLVSRSGKLSADLTVFRNRLGYEVSTFRLTPEKVDAVTSAKLKINNVPQDILDLYYTELVTLYRHRDSSVRDRPRAVSNRTNFEYKGYVKSGGTFYSLKVENGTLSLGVTSQEDWPFPVTCEALGGGWYEVTPYTVATDLTFAAGDRIRFDATGRVKVGDFAGATGPEGMRGFTQYSWEAGLPHGALIAKIGDGSYFLVGRERTVTVRGGGKLFLKINDRDRANNEGTFQVKVQKL